MSTKNQITIRFEMLNSVVLCSSPRLMKFRSEIENGSRHRRVRRKFTKVPHEKSFNSQRATNGKTAQKKANSNKMFFKKILTVST